MSTPWFFLSYASINNEHDGQVAKFCQDLRDALRVTAQLDKEKYKEEEIGFFAPEMGDGKSWPKGVADSLRTCRVLVCLYSGKYFTSHQCGKEFALFSYRLDAHAAASESGERLPRILPVLWVVPDGFPNSLPLAASNIHYQNEYTDRLIKAKGLFQLKAVEDDSAEYRRYVFYLAGHINEVAKETVLKELAEADPFEKIPNAWVKPPNAPAALEARLIAPRQIKLTWDDGESDAEEREPAAGNGSAKPARLDGFHVERLWHGGRADFSKLKTVRADSFSYTDARVSSGTKYRYRVCAFNSGGRSEYVETEDVETQGLPPPPMPSSLSGDALSGYEVELSWVDNSGGRAFFRIARCDSPPDGSFKRVGKTETGVTSYRDSGLQPATTYVYRVCASNDNEDDDNNSDSDEVEVKTLTPPPPPRRIPWLLLAVVAIAVAAAIVAFASTQRLRCLVVPSLCVPKPTPTPEPQARTKELSDEIVREVNQTGRRWQRENEWEPPKPWTPQWADKTDEDGWLVAQGKEPGVTKDYFDDFTLDVPVRFQEGESLGLLLRAHGDRESGYTGYCFVLERHGSAFNLYYYWGRPQDRPPSADYKRLGMEQFSATEGDSFQITARAEGEIFSFVFDIVNPSKTKRSSTDPSKAEVNAREFNVQGVEWPLEKGRVGLFAGDDGSCFEMNHIVVTPLKASPTANVK